MTLMPSNCCQLNPTRTRVPARPQHVAGTWRATRVFRSAHPQRRQKLRQRPFENYAELGRVIRPELAGTDVSQMHVNAGLAFDVAFEDGPPAYGAGVIEMLKTLLKIVKVILAQFEP